MGVRGSNGPIKGCVGGVQVNGLVNTGELNGLSLNVVMLPVWAPCDTAGRSGPCSPCEGPAAPPSGRCSAARWRTRAPPRTWTPSPPPSHTPEIYFRLEIIITNKGPPIIFIHLPAW